MMMVVVPQLLLNNPGRRYETEAADGDQSGGEQHPEAAHTAEHGGSSGQKARRQTQIDPEPDFFFFLLPAQERMHLELTPSKAGIQVHQVRGGCTVRVSRTSGNPPREGPERTSERTDAGQINSSHPPFFFLGWRNTGTTTQTQAVFVALQAGFAGVRAGGAGGASLRAANANMSRSRSPPPLLKVKTRHCLGTHSH